MTYLPQTVRSIKWVPYVISKSGGLWMNFGGRQMSEDEKEIIPLFVGTKKKVMIPLSTEVNTTQVTPKGLLDYSPSWGSRQLVIAGTEPYFSQ